MDFLSINIIINSLAPAAPCADVHIQKNGRYGGASSHLSLILELVAREMVRKHMAFYNTGFWGRSRGAGVIG